MHIKADILASFAISIPFQDTHLVKSAPQICASERFILVEFQSVLVIKMERPQLVETHRKVDFVRWIKPSQDAMSCFDESADSFGVPRMLRDRKSVSDRWNIRMVHRFIRLWFDCQPRFGIMREHFVKRLDQQFHTLL